MRRVSSQECIVRLQNFLILPSSTGTQEPQTPEEASQKSRAEEHESDTPSEEAQIAVSPEEAAEAQSQAQEGEDVEEAPAHPLVEVRGCEVLCV